MLRNLCLFLVAGLLAGAAPVRVEDAYTIKVKKNGKGAVTIENKQEIHNTTLKIVDPNGKVLENKKEQKTVTQAYKETILEKERGKRATKLRREYSKALVKIGDDERTVPYEGKTVLIEERDGKYHFTIEGGEELKGKDAELLNESFNEASKDDRDDEWFEKALLPKKPVRVNEAWSVDAEAIVLAFKKEGKFPLDKAKVSGTGKLLKVYKKDGRQFGVLDLRINLPLKGAFPLGPGMAAPIQAGSKSTVHIEFDRCIDGTSSDGIAEVATEMDATAFIKGPEGEENKMIFGGNYRQKSTEKDLSKK